MFLAFIAIGLVLASPATAGDDALRAEIQKLEKRVEALSNQQTTQLEQAVESYLDDSSAWKAADGDGMKNVTITAALTINVSTTFDMDPAEVHAVSGDADIGFHFQVTENLGLHITATAAAGGSTSSTPNLGSAPTFGGASDGVGTNGNASTTGTGRALNVYEAYIVGSTGTLHWETGAMDPRTRFLQNAYADNENTQFINNMFDDVASVLWQTGASGAGVLGIHLWMGFGGENQDQFTVSFGWFNPAGKFFNNGSVFIQFATHMDVGEGKGMNIRAMINLDDNNKDSSGDFTIAYGLSVDFELNDTVGLFLRFAGNDDDATRGNPVDMEVEIGAQLALGGNTLGVAVAVVWGNENLLGPLPEDLEITIEVYYRIDLQDGKLQVTPFIMYVMDPSASQPGVVGTNDTLFIVGFRVHVPF